MTLETRPDRPIVSEIAVEGLRFLDETGQDLIGAQMRAVLARAIVEFPALKGLKAHRLNLVPTLNVLTPLTRIEGLEAEAVERTYMVELEVVPVPALTHYSGYRLVIGAIDITSAFEEAYASWKTRTPLETLS
jgi:hypothetical protein